MKKGHHDWKDGRCTKCGLCESEVHSLGYGCRPKPTSTGVPVRRRKPRKQLPE